MMNYSLFRPRDGRWIFSKFPWVGLKLATRVLKRNQLPLSLVDTDRVPAPSAVLTAWKEHAGNRLAPSASQPPETGTGPFYYRRYTTEFSAFGIPASVIMARIQADPDRFTAKVLARYRKTKGKPGQMRVGDEFFIEMTGPWNAPVRVIEVTVHSFTFVTLRDHMEAGAIRFETIDRGGLSRFEIQSWSRSRDEGVDFFYDQVKVARLIQAEMWTTFSENVVRESGGSRHGPTLIATQRIPASGIGTSLPPAWEEDSTPALRAQDISRTGKTGRDQPAS